MVAGLDSVGPERERAHARASERQGRAERVETMSELAVESLKDKENQGNAEPVAGAPQKSAPAEVSQ